LVRAVLLRRLSGAMHRSASLHRKQYALLNDPTVRKAVLSAAAKRFGCLQKQVELQPYVGRFAGRSTSRPWLASSLTFSS